MNNYIKIVLFILVGILQLTFIPFFSVGGMYPNIVLIGVIILTLIDYEDDALMLAVFGGLVLDLSGPLFFGLNALLLIGLVLIYRYFINKIISSMNIMVITLSLLAGVVFYSTLINLFLGRWPSILLLYEAIYSLIIGLLLYWQFHKVNSQALTTKI